MSYRLIDCLLAGASKQSTNVYDIFTTDLPESEQTLTATYADDTAILASHEDPIVVTSKLQTHLYRLEQWLQQWHICANESKLTQVTFTLRREECPPVHLNGRPIPQSDKAKYLGLHLDRRLTWRTYIHAKRKTDVLDHGQALADVD